MKTVLQMNALFQINETLFRTECQEKNLDINIVDSNKSK